MESNLRVVEEMYFTGQPQVAIAARLGVRHQSVTYYLSKLNTVWQTRHAEKLEAHKARELARLDHVEREYWRAWERSQADSETATQAEAGDKTRMSLSKRSQAGDPRFLEGILRCIEMRLKIVGGFAPVRSEITGQDGGAFQIGVIAVDYRDGLATIEARPDEYRLAPSPNEDHRQGEKVGGNGHGRDAGA